MSDVEPLPALIDSVATRQFYPHLLDYLARYFHFHHAIIYAFERGAAPRCVMSSACGNSEDIRRLYQSGAWRQDPFRRVLERCRESQTVALSELVPGGIQRTRYYRDFYWQTGWHDEQAILLPQSGRQVLGVFLGSRQRRCAGDDRDSRQTRAVLKVVNSVVRLHASLGAAPPESEWDDAPSSPEALTPREREIVSLILAGMTTPQIAARLFISPGTVKNHRKNIYARLGISSQGELFKRFMAQRDVTALTIC